MKADTCRGLIWTAGALIASVVTAAVQPALAAPFPLYSVDSPNSQNGAFFGIRNTAIGDITGDGVADFVVGADHFNNGQGQVSVFSGADGMLLYTVDHPSPQNSSYFGHAHAGLGDVSGDAVPDFAVSAYEQNVGGNNDQGQVYVFSGVDGALLRTVDHPIPQSSAFFGHANIEGPGDVDGDGVPDLAVSASIQNVGGVNDVGQAYVFSGADWSLLYIIDHPFPQAGAQMGLQFGKLGDLDGDGIRELAAGALFQDVAGRSNQGQAYVFSGASGAHILTLDDPVPQGGAQFGDRIAELGDVDSDGVPDILIGVGFQNVGPNSHQGQAFVFSGAGGGHLYSVDDPNPQADALFGRANVGLPDVNGDGVPDLAVGAFYQNVGGNSRQGQAFVFSGLDGSHLFTVDNPIPQANADFGVDLQLLGAISDGEDTPLIVGARAQDIDGVVDAGKVFVFQLSATDVIIDIKPNDPWNLINPESLRGIWVAVLSADDFDAQQIDLSTVRFGTGGALVRRDTVADINSDGLPDLLMRFLVPQTGVACADDHANLFGATAGGEKIAGSDVVRPVCP